MNRVVGVAAFFGLSLTVSALWALPGAVLIVAVAGQGAGGVTPTTRPRVARQGVAPLSPASLAAAKQQVATAFPNAHSRAPVMAAPSLGGIHRPPPVPTPIVSINLIEPLVLDMSQWSSVTLGGAWGDLTLEGSSYVGRDYYVPGGSPGGGPANFSDRIIYLDAGKTTVDLVYHAAQGATFLLDCGVILVDQALVNVTTSGTTYGSGTVATQQGHLLVGFLSTSPDGTFEIKWSISPNGPSYYDALSSCALHQISD